MSLKRLFQNMQSRANEKAKEMIDDENDEKMVLKYYPELGVVRREIVVKLRDRKVVEYIKVDDEGKICYKETGEPVYHNPRNEPALIVYELSTGKKLKELYAIDGKPHRVGGPALIQYWDAEGDYREEFVYYYRDGKVHRTDGPAFIWYYPDGSVMKEMYVVDGKLHRVDGPAVIEYRNGDLIKRSELWCYDGKPYRSDGPIYVMYGENDEIVGEFYLKDGKLEEKWYKEI